MIVLVAATLVVLAVAAVLPAGIAHGKGEVFWEWWLYAVLLWPVALLHAIFVRQIDEMGRNPR